MIRHLQRIFVTDWTLNLYVCSIDVPQMAKQLKLTEEEAGRQARYDIFEQIATERGHAVIAVAHHKNDQAETVLMNIIRGSGMRGLCGMQPVRPDIIRPLLCVTRRVRLKLFN